LLPARYDAEDIRGKVRCKGDLISRLGLASKPETPLLAVVGQLNAQHGTDLLIQILPRVLRQDCQLVVLSDGDESSLSVLEDVAKRFPDRVAVRAVFDEALSHRVYAGADLFLSPARAEPCGMSHLYAMRYGAVPVGRATGGLKDTIVDADAALTSGNGFLFEQADAEEFYGAIARALSAWLNAPGFARVRRAAMRGELSWERSARLYQQLYSAIVPTKTAVNAHA